MIELQCINNIIDQNNIAEYLEQGIDVQYFTDHKDQWNFILEHYKTYNKVPDLATLLSVYPDFEVFQVAEPAKYLIDKLKEEHLYELSVNLFKQSAEMLKENSYEGLRNIIAKGEKLLFSKFANNVLNQNRDMDVSIYGYTDNQGWKNSTAAQSQQKNLNLSQERAQSVSSYLLSCGVSTNQIKGVQGMGESDPVASNDTAAGREQNRRVEVYMYASEQMIKDAQAASN